MVKRKMTSRIEIEEDHIAIFDNKGEIVRWVNDEWEENPSIVPTIANTILLICQGKNIRKILKEVI